MINCIQICFKFAFRFKLRRYNVAFTATDPIYGAELCSTTSYTTDTMVGPATSNIARRTSDIPGPVTSSTRDCNPPSLSQTASYDVARVYEG
jgi:hypothetical protein